MRAGAGLVAAALLAAGPVAAQDGTLPPVAVSPVAIPEAEGWTADLAARGAALIADLATARAEPDAAAAEARTADIRAAFQAGLEPIIALALSDMEAGLIGQGMARVDIETRMAGYREMLTPARLTQASELVFADALPGGVYPDESWKAAWLAVTGMDWKRRPAVDDRDFPGAARMQGISGWAVVSCSVGADGVPVDCVMDEESHPDLGFGQAALIVIRRARVNRILDAQTARFRVTIRFALAD